MEQYSETLGKSVMMMMMMMIIIMMMMMIMMSLGLTTRQPMKVICVKMVY